MHLNDKLPEGICDDCIRNVDYTFNFRMLIINSDKEFRARLQDSKNDFKQEEYNEHATVVDDANFSYEDEDASLDDVPLAARLVGVKRKPKRRKKAKPRKIIRNENGERIWQCNSCDFESTDAKEYQKHRRGHIPIYLCNICGKSVSHSNMKKHVENHSTVTATCEVCGKVCKNSVALEHHMHMHKGTRFKQFTCEVCSKVSNCYQAHKDHLKKHFREYTSVDF